MAKTFFDVFPTLKMESELKRLFEDTEITKVTTNTGKDYLHVHLRSHHIIEKRWIYKLENMLKEQLFAKTAIQIQVLDSYELSQLYTPENLIEDYMESFLTELRQESVVLSNLFQEARWELIADERLQMELEDNIVARGKADYLSSYLEQIFKERFLHPLRVEVTYREPKKSNLQEHNAIQLEQAIGAITSQYREVEERAQAEKQLKEQKKQEKEEKKQQKEAGKGSFQGGGRKWEGSYTSKLPDDPNLIYGRNFDDEAIPLSEVQGEMGEITFRGQVLSQDVRSIRNEKSIVIFSVTDFTDSITVKVFVRNDQLPEILTEVKAGTFLKIKGVTNIDKFDGELTIGSIAGIKKIPDFTVKRTDTYPEKRVELHCHTKMSDMDGVSDGKTLAKMAHDWGHPAIAITDHGVVQAFPDVNHYIEDINKKNPEDPFKIIYGVEAYLVDDLSDIATNERGQDLDAPYVVFDIETTGFSALKDEIIEIGAVKVVGGEIVEKFSTFVNPGRPIPYEISKLTGIVDEMVLRAPMIEQALPEFLAFAKDTVLVAHNASFDVGFIEEKSQKLGLEADFTYVDTVALARVLLPTLNKFKLNNVAKVLNISLENHHRAVDDAGATAEIFVKFISMLKEREIYTLQQVNEFGLMNPDAIKKLKTYHAIILAKNDVGRVNLYRLISMSHLDYYARRPRIPKRQFLKHREGLIIGSACEAGELYKAVLEEQSDERISQLVNFYDYLEIQPIGNNRFMIDSEKIPQVKSEEDLREINRKIVALGEQFKKPVVATCDVHFANPEDEVYRRIIMAGKGFDDADNQAPLYLRTTEEMLAEFEYLGSKKAHEVVIENTNKIADMIEKISPVRPDKCPPVIEDSDKQLREICYRKAHSMYGDPLPEIVVERLERELNSIISNGFAVMYIIAQKLVWKSVEDGYLVGSRGSVGSSFVATMAGITEVNPLSPHYYCTNCHYNDFTSEEVRQYAGGCGWDMPDKLCPECGQPLVKDGFDIPFETFLGFKGNKEPDIDLNFSGDYQSNAHKYTEIIFGDGQTFRAGTIAGLADKTAYGYVKHYFDDHGQGKRRCEIERLSVGCTGVRRSTGQHPGGIIVLPIGEDINSFTPVQHPANDTTTDIVTTHFDYHSIDHNLLKLDILGHDDPTMIKMLEELVEQLTGEKFVATDVKLDDKGVMALFHGTEILGIKPEDIGGTPVGCLGIPEFGTDFTIQMVVDTKPQTLTDLIRISGLSHGTDVWLNNAQDLIKSGQATISTCVSTRDDIMTYLINMGLDSEESFTIMERVRKGTVAKGKCAEWPEYKADMIAHNVPEWYIGSCEKIKYMFPKAHAAAYVMMAYRIAYCKVYYPLAYYAAYFSIRAKAFSYELMCQGKERLEFYIRDYKKRSDSLTNKEQDTLRDMRLVQEMYARGFEFLPIDLYHSKATKFQIVDGKLLPPFSSIEGMGDKAADAVEIAAMEGAFISKDDFRQRTKVSKTVIDKMDDFGIFGDLPESNQLSIFDF